METKNHPYRAFLPSVAKPARYVGGEHQQIVKDPDSVRVRMALAFPDIYDIGMSHLGTKILYSLLNKHSEFSAERVFCPWVDMEKQLRERGLPLLSLETASPLTDFDVVGFSLQYELTYTNILTMLDLSGIPFRWRDRDEDHPLIVAGGPCATQPEPMAPFVDVFLIGDAEERLTDMLEVVAEAKENNWTRRRTLVALAKLDGLYCPALYNTKQDPRTGFHLVDKPVENGVPERVKRVILEDINQFAFPDDSPVAAAEAIFDRMSVEIARGCTEGCRFCQAGMIYRPVRERDPEEIVKTLISAVKKGGYDEASMTTLSTADYSCISPLIKKVMEKLRPEKVSLSVASLRAYGLDESTLDEIRSVRANGLTFAPEAGTQRMRDVINKNISDEDLEQTAHRVFSRGWRRMKLYFMIGLPTETEEDVAGIMHTGRHMRNIGRGYHPKRAGVTVSVSSHVPKPHTPFQWAAMDPIDVIESKQDLLSRMSKEFRLEFRRHDPRTSYLECILGRGDRRMADLIEGAWRKGARFDSWDEHLAWKSWMETLEEHSHIDYASFTGTIPTDVELPWEHLDMQLERKFLLTDYRRSMRDKLSPPCGKPVGGQVHHTNLDEHEQDQRILVCYNCGVACDMTGMREERGDFLKKLGAYEPPAADTVRAEAPVKSNGKKPHNFDQGDPVRYRIRYAKTGVSALTGHLDFVRTLPRVIRRAGVESYYSEGFHPKPVMEFGPPLPLGVEGLNEVADIALTHWIDEDALLEKLNASAPPGLVFSQVEHLPQGSKKISKVLTQAEYVVRLTGENLNPVAIEKFMEQEEVRLQVERKRRPKTVNIRPAVMELAWTDHPSDNKGSGEPALWMRLDLRSEAHTRPEEVVRALVGITEDAQESNPAERDVHISPAAVTRTRLSMEASVKEPV